MQKQIDMTPPDPARMAWYELNDIGNAKRLRDLAEGKLLWVEDHWRGYDNQRWSAEAGQRLAEKLGSDVARHLPIEAEALADKIAAMDRAELADLPEGHDEHLSALYKWGITSGNMNKIAGMLAAAKVIMFAQRDAFDADPLALNVQNGTLRLRRIEGQWQARLRPHDPADLITRIMSVAYDPKAEAPEWAGHMATVLPSAAVRRFFQLCSGYGLTGEITEQCIFLLQGKGGDGKSTTMDVLRQHLGDYGAVAGVESFIAGQQRGGGEASPDMARLAGDCRMVSTGEPRVGAALDEARIKTITGGQPLTARELHGKPFEYVPRFKLWFECNRKPRISGDDDGIWRRVVVIQFPHQFKGAADKRFKDRLLGEGPGILNWLLDGALAWLEAGALVPPGEVQEAIDDYRRASNPFGEWFAEWVDTKDPEQRCLAGDLFDSYKKWCEDQAVGDREIMSSTAFGRALGDKQIPKMKGANGRVYRRGVRLRSLDEMPGLGGAASEPVPMAGGNSDPFDPDGWVD